ncbi:MAG: protein jag [Bdellovibrionales bacterium]
MNFLKKLFGMGKGSNDSSVELVEETLETLGELSGLEYEYEVDIDGQDIKVELSGEDSNILKEKDAQLLDAIQFFTKRSLQHSVQEGRYNVHFDCEGYREEADNALIELADKLKGIALDKKKSVYFRALPPRDRRVIHQYLADDDRIVSKSIGDGLFKKIKVFPANQKFNKNKKKPAQQKNAN